MLPGGKLSDLLGSIQRCPKVEFGKNVSSNCLLQSLKCSQRGGVPEFANFELLRVQIPASTRALIFAI
jgi:hypothetical protein